MQIQSNCRLVKGLNFMHKQQLIALKHKRKEKEKEKLFDSSKHVISLIHSVFCFNRSFTVFVLACTSQHIYKRDEVHSTSVLLMLQDKIMIKCLHLPKMDLD